MPDRTLLERLFPALITGDHHTAGLLVNQALSSGATVPQLAHHTYVPLLKMVQDLRAAGQLSTRAHEKALALLRALLLRAARNSTTPSSVPETDDEDDRRTPTRLRDDHAGRDPPPPERGTDGNALFVTMSVTGGVLRARPVGPHIGDRAARIITRQVSRSLDELGCRCRRFVLDLTDVAMISSVALAELADLPRRARRLGAHAVLYGLSPDLARLYRLLRRGDRIDKRTERIETAGSAKDGQRATQARPATKLKLVRFGTA